MHNVDYYKYVSVDNLAKITEPLTKNVKLPDIRGWVLLDPDINHLKYVFARCDEFRINHIQISHAIVHSASQLFYDRWRIERVNFISKLARKKNIKTFLWTHELDAIPKQFFSEDGRIDIRKDDIWAFIEKRYCDVFDMVDVDGLVLTFQETEGSVYYDDKVISDDAHSLRVKKLIDVMYDVCRAFGKELIVRTFCYNRQEMSWILDGLENAADDIIFMVKVQPADWNPYYPHNSLIKYFADRDRNFIVEFDLGEEYHGQCKLPYIYPAYFRYRLNYVLNQQSRLAAERICGAVGRIERYSGHALNSLNEINLKLFSTILADPYTNESECVKKELDIIFTGYSDELVEPLLKIFDIVNVVVYMHPAIWGVLMHTAVADYIYVYDSLANWPQLDEWIADTQIKNIGSKILAGDEKTHKFIYERLNQAESDVKNISDKLFGIINKMPIELSIPLYNSIIKLQAFVLVNIYHHRTFLAVQRWLNTNTQTDKMLAEEYFASFKKIANKYLEVISSMRTEGLYLNREGIRLFSEQIETILQGNREEIYRKYEVRDFVKRYRYDKRISSYAIEE